MSRQVKDEDIAVVQQAPFDQLAEYACVVEIAMQQQQVCSRIGLAPVVNS